MIGTPSAAAAAALILWAARTKTTTRDNSGGSNGGSGWNARSFQTPADGFYKEHNKIPLPPIVHASLPELLSAAAMAATTTDPNETETNKKTKKNILVIGDVHGCYDELLKLHALALVENDSIPFECVILVGDLVNKGPLSASVVKHVRSTPGWISVRGNHDDGALAAALGDQRRLKQETYRWVANGNNENNTEEGAAFLCDDDVHWLSQLPYTISIPGDLLGEDEDTLVVHAGLVPYRELGDQTISTMTTIRDVLSRCDDDGKFTHFEDKDNATAASEAAPFFGRPEAPLCETATPWALAWGGPQRVVFGHDARRKLQLTKDNLATGLDTGAVYGGELSGIILPERKLVSVPSPEYSPIVKKKKNNIKVVASLGDKR